jgi:hypothetical protein
MHISVTGVKGVYGFADCVDTKYTPVATRRTTRIAAGTFQLGRVRSLRDRPAGARSAPSPAFASRTI